MRRGEMVATFETAETSPPELADAMVGRKVILKIDKGPAHPGKVALEARNLVVRDDRGVARVARRLVRRCARARSSASPASPATASRSCWRRSPASGRSTSGEILVDGRPLQRRRAQPARRAQSRRRPRARGPPARRPVMPFEACESAMLGFHDQRTFGRGSCSTAGAIVADAGADDGGVRRPAARAAARTANFSGGNQQKIVLAREIDRDPTHHAGRPADPRRRHRRDRVHPQAHRRRCATRARRCCWCRSNSTRSSRSSDRILVMCGGRIIGERAARGRPTRRTSAC